MGNCRIRVHLRLRPSSRPSTFIHVDNVTSTVRIDIQKVHGGGPPRPFLDQMVFPLDSIIQVRDFSTHTPNDLNLDIKLSQSKEFTKPF